MVGNTAEATYDSFCDHATNLTCGVRPIFVHSVRSHLNFGFIIHVEANVELPAAEPKYLERMKR